jgi:hypothetical protein
VVTARAGLAGSETEIEQVGLVQRALDLDRHAFGLHRRQQAGVEFLQDDDELVAAQTRHGIAFADAGFHARRDLDQELVADIMTQGVVEGLEVVEVEQHQRRRGAMPRAGGQRLAQAIEHQAAIGQLVRAS